MYSVCADCSLARAGELSKTLLSARRAIAVAVTAIERRDFMWNS